MADIYKDFDLGAFDESLRGQTIPLLQNPTRAFRQSYLRAEGMQFLEHVARCINTDVAGVEVTLGQYEQSLFAWLFFVVVGDDGKPILPYIYTVWDEYTVARVKALRAPLALSSEGATNAQG